jgi:hypothetical protein
MADRIIFRFSSAIIYQYFRFAFSRKIVSGNHRETNSFPNRNSFPLQVYTKLEELVARQLTTSAQGVAAQQPAGAGGAAPPAAVPGMTHTVSAALALMEALAKDHIGYVERFMTPLGKMLHRHAREHAGQPAPAAAVR